MIRRVIKIDEEKCNGCGICVTACHEGAIAMVDGKAKLIRDDYCDGLGNCLPACPTGAISFEEREALPFDEAAVAVHMAKLEKSQSGGCPGSAARTIQRRPPMNPASLAQSLADRPVATAPIMEIPSELRQWPVQLQLAPINAPWLQGCDLLIAADCTAFAGGDFHQRFIRGKVTLIACPKLDDAAYTDKLTAMFMQNSIHSITVVRMEVPCCGGIVRFVTEALERSGKDIPLQVAILGVDGQVVA